MERDGVSYTDGMQKVLDDIPIVGTIDSIENQIGSGIVNAIDAPFEAFNRDVLGSDQAGPVKTIFGSADDGLVYVIGEDKAAATWNILETVAGIKVIKGGINYNPSNTSGFWKSLDGVADDALSSAIKEVYPTTPHTTPLYRAVSADEARSIANSGALSTNPGVSVEGKYFTDSVENATKLQGELNKNYSTPYTNIIEVNAPRNSLNDAYFFKDAGKYPAVYIPENNLNQLVNPKIIQ